MGISIAESSCRKFIDASALRACRALQLKGGEFVISDDFAPDRAAPRLPDLSAVAKRFVYGLRSITDRHRFYVGVTSDVPARIEWHNAGRCRYTAKNRPWELVVAVEFAKEDRALAFERYLKSGSGRAFAKRHFEV